MEAFSVRYRIVEQTLHHVQLARPFKGMVTVQRWSDARPAGLVTGQVLASIQCREPKAEQQKVQLSSETKHVDHLGMINLCN